MSFADLTASPMVIRRRTETMWLPVYKDKDNQPYQTTAAQMLLKPIYEPHAIVTYHGWKYFPSGGFSESQVRTLADAVNSGAFMTAWQAGEAWVSEINSDPVNENNSSLELFHFVIRCLKNGWKTRFPDVGYFYITDDNATAFTDSDGNLQLAKLNNNDGDLAGLTDDLQLLEFSYKNEEDLTPLGFG